MKLEPFTFSESLPKKHALKAILSLADPFREGIVKVSLGLKIQKITLEMQEKSLIERRDKRHKKAAWGCEVVCFLNRIDERRIR